MAPFGNMISTLLKVYFFALIILAPALMHAEGIIRLTGLPNSAATDFSTTGYINALYILSISVAAFLAVARIILAGVQYMLSDVITDKSAARKQITGALLGLLIVISAVLVLETINPQLTNWSALDRIEKIQPRAQGGIDVLLEEVDRTGTVSLEGLTTEEKTIAITKKRDQCAGKEVITLINSVSCDNSKVTSGSVNTLERFTSLVGADDEVSIETYNQFISAVEPDSIVDSEIASIVSDAGGSDYLFVVKNFSGSGNAREREFRTQQEIFCENRLLGGLVNSGDISVCVIE